MVLILAAICGEATAQQDAAQGAYDLSKYILTPKAAPTPRINGAVSSACVLTRNFSSRLQRQVIAR